MRQSYLVFLKHLHFYEEKHKEKSLAATFFQNIGIFFSEKGITHKNR